MEPTEGIKFRGEINSEFDININDITLSNLDINLYRGVVYLNSFRVTNQTYANTVNKISIISGEVLI